MQNVALFSVVETTTRLIKTLLITTLLITLINATLHAFFYLPLKLNNL
jgi:hypothetical protein